MVSTLRRKSRRYQYGASLCTGSRVKERVPVRGITRVLDWISKLAWSRSLGRNPWASGVAQAYGFCLDEWIEGSHLWDIGFRATDPPVATHRAEKSLRTPRKSRRGLRKGRRRSRGRHPRSPPPARQPTAATPRNRKVNHYRRSEKWLIAASERLHSIAKKFVKSSTAYSVRGKRLKMKTYYAVVWSRFSAQAKKCGFPPFASFGTSPWRWLDMEFPGWHLKDGEPSRVPVDLFKIVRNPFTYLDPPVPPHSGQADNWEVVLTSEIGKKEPEKDRAPVRGASSSRGVPTPRNRACRMCGYFGPPPHEWNACRPLVETRWGRSSVGRRGPRARPGRSRSGRGGRP